jgi:hypothetical protein
MVVLGKVFLPKVLGVVAPPVAPFKRLGSWYIDVLEVVFFAIVAIFTELGDGDAALWEGHGGRGHQ